jgi:hypothetical protein
MTEEINNRDLEFVENLIFDCAFHAGFKTDGENFFAGSHGEVDVTEELFDFTVLMAAKMRLMLSPNTTTQ